MEVTMKFTYLRLKGYTRIFNGLGLPEIEIDFTKCKNRKIGRAHV